MDWAIRIAHENRYSKGSAFITLTYNEKFLPRDGMLVKSHLQKYFKRLRKLFKEKLRYYAVGEYGTKSQRPHYHILLFNIDRTEHEKVRQAWTLGGIPIGHVHIGNVDTASIIYCLKYVVQPEQKEKEVKPFSTMSRAYGIGGMYLQDHIVEWHRMTESNFMRDHDKIIRMPKFYKEKIWYKEEDKIKIRQKAEHASRLAEAKNLAKLFQQGYGYQDVKEMRDAFTSRIKTKVAFTEKI